MGPLTRAVVLGLALLMVAVHVWLAIEIPQMAATGEAEPLHVRIVTSPIWLWGVPVAGLAAAVWARRNRAIALAALLCITATATYGIVHFT